MYARTHLWKLQENSFTLAEREYERHHFDAYTYTTEYALRCEM